MDGPISNGLRTTFLAHFIIALLLGAAFLLIPGRTLGLLGWVPAQVQLPNSDLSIPGGTFVDPVITRGLGAALLALAFSSFRSWRAPAGKSGGINIIVQTEVLFCVLGIAALASGAFLMGRPLPIIGWVLAAILAIFAIFFGLALRPSNS